jgi:hypothetical protein
MSVSSHLLIPDIAALDAAGPPVSRKLIITAQ